VSASLDDARAAKEKLSDRLGSHELVRGIGIARLEDGYGVKVDLARTPDELELPDELDGVRVVVEVVGKVSKRGGG
jgi:hypothetical protein